MPRIAVLPQDDADNGWSRTIAPRMPKPPLKGEHTADLIIIGAGFAGLAAAWHYARQRPADRVALIEAQTVGEGASGRNSGFVLGLKHSAESADPTNLEPAKRVRSISQAAMRFLEEIVTENAIDCDWKRDGMYIAAGGSKGLTALERLRQEFTALGEESRLLSGEAAARETGAHAYRAMLYSPNCILMQPVKLVRGMAEHLPANVMLCENSPVTSIDYGPKVRAVTAEGSVTAPKLILAVNMFAPQFGFWKNRVFPLQLFASLTRPLTAAEQTALGAKPWGILPAVHTTSPTMRYTEDRRILMRAQYSAGFSLEVGAARYAQTRAHHEALLRLRFPMLPDLGFEHTWCGIVCLSRNFGHATAKVADNVFTAVCENGVGATKSVVSGIVAADMALGRENALGADLAYFGEPALLPPSPLFEWAFALRRNFEKWRDRAET